MHPLHRFISSPHQLLAFEAAARHLSFSKAAVELNVTQPAVSHAVKSLELSLGIPLFLRQHRSITLTDEGKRFYADTSFGLMHIQRSAERISARGQQPHVTLSVSTAFANYWVVPRLGDFQSRHPGIELRLQTTDRDLDLAEEGLSLGLRRGEGVWHGYDTTLVAKEVLHPVASPKFAAAHPGIRDLETLACERLIHLEEPYRLRPTWVDWFAAMRTTFQDEGRGLRLNDYALVVQTAMAGEGIALGWSHIVRPLISQGLLVAIGDWRWHSRAGFYLIWSRKTELSRPARIVRDWIIEVSKPDRSTSRRSKS